MASAELDLTINAKLNSFNTDFKTIIDPDSSLGYDGFDLIAPIVPNNYSRLYSTVEDNSLSVDVWPSSEIPREIILTYDNDPLTSSSLNLSWSFSDPSYAIALYDYGTDPTRNNLVAAIDLSSTSNYKVNFNVVRYFSLKVDNPTVVSPGGGGSGGSSGGGVLDQCKESNICVKWDVCQNLEESFKLNVIGGEDYNFLKTNCSASFFNESSCGFQTRRCTVINACENIKLPPQIQACQFVENPSCTDGVKDCHDGKCEVLVDCSGPCQPCATCSDKVKNQGEKGVDCEGPCPGICQNNNFIRNTFGRSKLPIYIYIGVIVLLLVILIILIYKLIKIYKKSKNESLNWYKM